MAPPPSRTTLTLVRHGEATWNVARRLQGHRDDSVLTDAGRAQARAAADTLVGGYDSIVASDLARARETAEVIAGVLGVDVALNVAWRERDLGDIEGDPLAAATPELVGIARGVIVDLDAAPAGGESLREFAER
ncbi:MAG: histidine phosphatase family protein, partial [Acidimicrobiales bacterium]